MTHKDRAEKIKVHFKKYPDQDYYEHDDLGPYYNYYQSVMGDIEDFGYDNDNLVYIYNLWVLDNEVGFMNIICK